eukprot:752952-Rhodomonas_salina.2
MQHAATQAASSSGLTCPAAVHAGLVLAALRPAAAHGGGGAGGAAREVGDGAEVEAPDQRAVDGQQLVAPLHLPAQRRRAPDNHLLNDRRVRHPLPATIRAPRVNVDTKMCTAQDDYEGGWRGSKREVTEVRRPSRIPSPTISGGTSGC